VLADGGFVAALQEIKKLAPLPTWSHGQTLSAFFLVDRRCRIHEDVGGQVEALGQARNVP
jgi:hypothetical protein